MIVHVFVANWIQLSPKLSKSFITAFEKDAKPYIMLYGEKSFDKEQYVKLYSELGFSDYTFCQSFGQFIKQVYKLRKNAFLFHFGRYHWFLAAFLLGCRNINWVCWGSGAKKRSSMKSHLIYPLKRFLYHRFNSIVTLMEPDRKSIIHDFHVNPEIIRTIPYSSTSGDGPIDILCKNLSQSHNRSEKPLVLLGNNPTCISSYLKILPLLQKYKGKIKVQCMLNYDLTKDERYEKLITLGKSLFGSDFRSNEEFHEGVENYVNYMNTCDVYICGVEKQTGLGAIMTCLKLGKKIFIAGKNLEWIREEFNAKVYSFDSIKEMMSYEDFIKPLTKEEVAYNYECAIKHRDVYFDNWKKYLKSIDNK